MKWPETLTLVRHATSDYNVLQGKKDANPCYKSFKKAYNEDPESDKSKELALEVHKLFAPQVGDHNTPLVEGSGSQAEIVGKKLKEIIALPSVIFVSPYLRTCSTLEYMIRGWPELADVKTIEEERIREQDHGTSTLYSDWRVFNVLHPEQRLLRELQKPYWYRYPQGENVPDVRERLRSWLSTLTRDYNEQGVLAITHHLAILSLRANLERLGEKAFTRLDEEAKPINCGVTIYRGYPNEGSDGRLELEYYNLNLYNNPSV